MQARKIDVCMFHTESPIVRFLTITGTIVGLVTGLITLYQVTIEKVPALNAIGVQSIGVLTAWATIFREYWTFSPIVSALMVYGVVVVVLAVAIFVTYSIDSVLEYVTTLLLLLPLPAVWIWLFFDAVSSKWLVAFVVGYIALPGTLIFGVTLAVAFVDFLLEERREQRRAITGVISKVTVKKRTYTLIVDRGADVPVKAAYKAGSDESFQIETGTRVRLFGRWEEGVFLVHRVEDQSASQRLESSEQVEPPSGSRNATTPAAPVPPT